MPAPVKHQAAEAVAYLQVKLERRSTHFASVAKVVAVTQKKPTQLKPGCICVKVKIRVPVEGWDPYSPSATIDVPLDLVQVDDIQVVAE